MGAPIYPQKGRGGWWGGVVPPAIPPFPPPPYPAVVPVYPLTPVYPGALPPARMRQHQQAGGATWGAQGGKGQELRRAWERIGKEERRLQGREAQAKGEAAGAAEGRASSQGTPGGGEAQVVKELQIAWADLGWREWRGQSRTGSVPGNRRRGAEGWRVALCCSHSGSRLSRRRWRETCRRGPVGGSGARHRGWRTGTGRWRSGSAG